APACTRLTSPTSRWKPGRPTAVAPDLPRSSSITTTSFQPRLRAGPAGRTGGVGSRDDDGPASATIDGRTRRPDGAGDPANLLTTDHRALPRRRRFWRPVV